MLSIHRHVSSLSLKIITMILTVVLCMSFTTISELSSAFLVDKYWVFDSQMNFYENDDKFVLKSVATESETLSNRYKGGYRFNQDGTYRELPQLSCGTYPAKKLRSGTWELKSKTIYLYKDDEKHSLEFNRILVRDVLNGMLVVSLLPNF